MQADSVLKKNLPYTKDKKSMHSQSEEISQRSKLINEDIDTHRVYSLIPVFQKENEPLKVFQKFPKSKQQVDSIAIKNDSAIHCPENQEDEEENNIQQLDLFQSPKVQINQFLIPNNKINSKQSQSAFMHMPSHSNYNALQSQQQNQGIQQGPFQSYKIQFSKQSEIGSNDFINFQYNPSSIQDNLEKEDFTHRPEYFQFQENMLLRNINLSVSECKDGENNKFDKAQKRNYFVDHKALSLRQVPNNSPINSNKIISVSNRQLLKEETIQYLLSDPSFILPEQKQQKPLNKLQIIQENSERNEIDYSPLLLELGFQSSHCSKKSNQINKNQMQILSPNFKKSECTDVDLNTLQKVEHYLSNIERNPDQEMEELQAINLKLKDIFTKVCERSQVEKIMKIIDLTQIRKERKFDLELSQLVKGLSDNFKDPIEIELEISFKYSKIPLISKYFFPRDTIKVLIYKGNIRIDYKLCKIENKQGVYQNSSLILNLRKQGPFSNKIFILKHDAKTYSYVYEKFNHEQKRKIANELIRASVCREVNNFKFSDIKLKLQNKYRKLAGQKVRRVQGSVNMVKEAEVIYNSQKKDGACKEIYNRNKQFSVWVDETNKINFNYFLPIVEIMCNELPHLAQNFQIIKQISSYVQDKGAVYKIGFQVKSDLQLKIVVKSVNRQIRVNENQFQKMFDAPQGYQFVDQLRFQKFLENPDKKFYLVSSFL